MSMMTNYRALDYAPNINNFASKSDAVKFAIEFTARFSDDGTERIPNLDAAQALYDFICKNVELPETQLAQWGDVIANANEIAEMVKQHFIEQMNKAKANENTAG